MYSSEWIYSKDTLGNIRVWKYDVEGDQWRTVTGLLNGKHITSGWTVSVPKNIGRVNETSSVDQAFFEANAEKDKKLSRDYRRTIDELDLVPVQCMLAQDVKKQKNINFPIFSQPKLDGIRSITRKDGAFTREFKRHMNLEHITNALDPIFDLHHNLIIDGEAYNHEAHDNFNKIASVVRKSVNITEQDRKISEQFVQYHVYDIINDDDFTARTQDVKEILHGLEPYIHVVPTTLCNNQAEVDELFKEYIEQGYEGQILRLPKGGYDQGKRSKKLIKRKDFDTDEFVLLEIREGLGNWSNCAKSVTVRLPDGSTNDSGIRGTQEYARHLLENKHKYIGQTVTIRYFGYTPDGKLRFPVVIDFGNRVD